MAPMWILIPQLFKGREEQSMETKSMVHLWHLFVPFLQQPSTHAIETMMHVQNKTDLRCAIPRQAREVFELACNRDQHDLQLPGSFVGLLQLPPPRSSTLIESLGIVQKSLYFSVRALPVRFSLILTSSFLPLPCVPFLLLPEGTGSTSYMVTHGRGYEGYIVTQGTGYRGYMRHI